MPIRTGRQPSMLQGTASRGPGCAVAENLRFCDLARSLASWSRRLSAVSEQLQHVLEGRAVDSLAANADASRSARRCRAPSSAKPSIAGRLGVAADADTAGKIDTARRDAHQRRPCMMTPAQFVPTSRTRSSSMIESTAKGGGANTMLVPARGSRTAAPLQVLKTGRPRGVWLSFPGVTPPTSLVR